MIGALQIGQKVKNCLLISTLVWVVTGCSSKYILKESSRPFGVIRAVVKESLPRGERQVSVNGREFDSNYFSAEGIFDEDASTKPKRAYAHVIILGAGRPYEIEVAVHIETRRSNGTYVEDGISTQFSEELGHRIEVDLAHRRDDRNVIDDFRVF